MTTEPTILVVEDDQGTRESLAMVLEFQKYSLFQAETGEQGLDRAAQVRPDLIILDINLPGIDGLETCRRLRGQGHSGPILMLTARHEVADRVEGLDAGADDYLPKPFALDELLARVRSMLRRGGVEQSSTTLTLADLHIDMSARIARRAGTQLDLTKREFDLLSLLVLSTDVVLTRDIIRNEVWGPDDDPDSNSLEVFVSSLRKKTEHGGHDRLIHTVRGVGYVARTS